MKIVAADRPPAVNTAEIICIVCPKGCRIRAEWTEEPEKEAAEGFPSVPAGSTAEKKGLVLSGYSCRHGREYAREEFLHPTRFFTGTAAVEGAARKRLPVRTDHKIPKDCLKECAEIAAGLKLQAPVSIGEPLTGPLFGTDARLVASMTLEAEQPAAKAGTDRTAVSDTTPAPGAAGRSAEVTAGEGGPP